MIGDPPTVEELMTDPSTPYWASDLIRTRLLALDPVDVANTLAVLAATFAARVERPPCGWCIAEAGHEMPEGIEMVNCEKHSS